MNYRFLAKRGFCIAKPFFVLIFFERHCSEKILPTKWRHFLENGREIWYNERDIYDILGEVSPFGADKF